MMRPAFLGFSLVFLLLAPAAGSAERVEYGKREELRNVRSVLIAAKGNTEVADEARSRLSELLPLLLFAEREDAGDVTLTLTRQLTANAEAESQAVVTTARATRKTRSATRLYCDATSRQDDPAAAVEEVLIPFVDMLRAANPQRFGVDTESPGARRQAVHSTEGLKPGMSKRDVRLAIGRPLKRDRGHAFTETWTYATTEGTMRLVFGGDRLQSIVFEKK
jgi:hypothetical protein